MLIKELQEGIDRIGAIPSLDKIRRHNPPMQKFLRLPGGSGLLYAIDKISKWRTEIVIYTASETPIGILELQKYNFGPIEGMVVEAIQVIKDYQNQGIAKSLYGIALTKMKINLFSGHAQTPGGRRNWLSLVKIPGCEVKGIVALPDQAFEQNGSDPAEDAAKQNMIDGMMNIGGEYLGIKSHPASGSIYRYFAFDVVAGNGELEPAVKKAVTLYSFSGKDGSQELKTNLFARWVG